MQTELANIFYILYINAKEILIFYNYCSQQTFDATNTLHIRNIIVLTICIAYAHVIMWLFVGIRTYGRKIMIVQKLKRVMYGAEVSYCSQQKYGVMNTD